jgi:DNA-binding LacI/PurR family transcriptional regulator
MATIHDVAKECGVSITTVSLVLNNSTRPVNIETRKRVQAAARRLNYHPSAVARGLVQRRMYSLGVYFCTVEESIVTNAYASGVLQGVFQEGTRREYDVHLFTTPWKNAETSAARFRDRRTDGTLVIAPTRDSDIVERLHGLGLPLVVVSAPTTVPGVPYVDVDDAEGGRIAARHLLSLGHQRIAHLAGDENQSSVRQRRDAFLTTLAEAGMILPPEYLPPGTFNIDGRYENACRILDLPNRPTAIFATNDDIAFAVLRAARERGISVPEQLSVIGFDDYPAASLTFPALTTIHHPLRSIGARATQLLIERVEGTPITELRHIFTPELVVRDTTAPPSAFSS